MKQESQLACLYCLGSLTSLTATICMAIAWLYWQRTLDTCGAGLQDPKENCGCILSGTWIPSEFRGGPLALCQFTTIGPIPVVLWSFIMFAYHSYRVSFPTTASILVQQDNGVRRRRAVRKERKGAPHILEACLGCLFTILLLSSGIVMTLGYFETCSQYRKSVINQVSATGELALMFLNRISCGSILDFMDYLQPDPPSLEYKYRRTSRILTNITLELGIVCAWASSCCFIIVTIYHIILAKRSKTTRAFRGSKLLESKL